MSFGRPEIGRPVSLKDWVLSPSIDFITLRLSSYAANATRRALIAVDSSIASKVKVARTTTGSPTDVLTIHDPSVAELQQLVNLQPYAAIHEIEFTVDFRPKGGPAGLDELAPLYGWLRDCVFPPMPRARQKAYSSSTNKYELRHKTGNAALTTRKWDNSISWEQIRLYMKTEDHGKLVDRPSVRLEVTWSGGAPQDHNLICMGKLVEFAPMLRVQLSKYFLVAAGIKPKERRVRNPDTAAGQNTLTYNRREAGKVERMWSQRGAMWAVEKGYEVYPHREATKRIGVALSKLQKRLSKLVLPENSCLPIAAESAEGRMVLTVDDFSTLTPIDVPKSLYNRHGKKALPKHPSVPMDSHHSDVRNL